MTKLTWSFLLIAVLTFTAAGCGKEEATPAPEIVPSEEPTPEPEIIPSEEPTAQPTPTQTPEPTQQATPTPSLGDTRARPLDGMDMVYAPAGEFEMGSDGAEVDYALQQCLEYGTNCRRRYFSVEQPMHTVALDGFWLDKTEVSQGQYAQCVGAGACDAPDCQEEDPSGGENLPVVCVTWEQAAAYCAWAGGRLPTEAEWEYAARGPAGPRYPWGDELDGALLNYCDANCAHNKRDEDFDDGYARSAPVGSYPGGASWVGALDMAGNVWEVVADWNGNYGPERQLNPTGPASGMRRVARGGSWNASADHVRTTLRTHVGPNDSIPHAGFRCAQSAP